jgi:flagellar biosynthesis/type III secretory pathway protein FliH
LCRVLFSKTCQPQSALPALSINVSIKRIATINTINQSCCGDNPIGRLMSDFQETDTHQFHNKLLAEQVKFLKQTDAGRKGMSSLEQLMKKTYAEGRSKGEIEGRKQGEIEGRKKGIEESSVNTAVRLLNQGALSADQIAEATGLTRERILQLQTQQPLIS